MQSRSSIPLPLAGVLLVALLLATPPASATVPGAPRNLVAQAVTCGALATDPCTIRLCWDTPPAGGVPTSYLVYRGSPGAPKSYIGSTTTRSGLCPGYSSGGGYTWVEAGGCARGTACGYEAAAANADGTGAHSGEAVVNTRPQPPVNVRLVADQCGFSAGSGCTLGLCWDNAPNSPSSVTYRLYGRAAGGGKSPLGDSKTLSSACGPCCLDSTKGFWVEDTGCPRATVCGYAVTAFDAAAESLPSAEATASTTPLAPRNFRVQSVSCESLVNKPCSVALCWDAPAPGGPTNVGYKLYRGPHGGAKTLIQSGVNDFGASAVRIDSCGPMWSDPSCCYAAWDSGCARGTTCDYEVRASTNIDDGPPSSTASATLSTAPLPWVCVAGTCPLDPLLPFI